VAFLALDAVHPVTHAVGNTLKRVFVIVSSVVLFKTPLTNQGIVGSAIAIIGVLIYSLVKVRDSL
jgi:solute carrier family 35, member E1